MKKKLLTVLILLAAISFVIFFGVFIKNFFESKSSGQGGSVSLSSLLSKAKEMQSKGDFSGQKKIYDELVNNFPNSNEVMNWIKKSEEINIKLLFSPVLTPKSISYEIKPGDTLTRIAREYKTTPDLIKKSNNLTSDVIIPGRKIKVWTVPFSILVKKSQNILLLKSDEEIIKTYVVSTGKNNSTPTGNFKITSKLVNPTWFKAGAVVPPGSPENILGTRWMGIDVPSYGLHGTTEPQDLGKQVTQGCVRLSNQDVEELYTIVPLGTEVVITD